MRISRPVSGILPRMFSPLKGTAPVQHLSIFFSISPIYVYKLLWRRPVLQTFNFPPQMPIHRRTCYTCGRHRPRLMQTIYRCARCLYVRAPYASPLCWHRLVSLNTVHGSARRGCGLYISTTVKCLDSTQYQPHYCTPRRGNGWKKCNRCYLDTHYGHLILENMD